MYRTKIRNYRLLVTGVLICSLLFSMVQPIKAYAYGITQTDVKMYTTSGTPVYATPDVNSGVVAYLERFVNVTVTGITDNGFYRIDLNGDYYIPGPYLISSVQPAKTEKQKALENLDKFAKAYADQLEIMKDYSTAFALLDVTGDGVPELFDLAGQEIYTYYGERAVMMYYSEYPVTFYYDKKDNKLLGKYTCNKQDIWEVYYTDNSLLPWGQIRCFSTDASAYKANSTAVAHSYTNDDETRADMYNILKKLLSL